MIQAILIIGTLGLVVGVGLAVASKVFYVYVDPKIEAVEGALPGANCGGCGYPGCSANAEAIVAGKSSPSSCVAGSAELAQIIAAIIGASVEAKEPDIARKGCYYSKDIADIKYFYDGINDCRAAKLINGGEKVCNIGCLGLGSCVKACPFNALKMGEDGLPVVDEKKCTGCGTCEKVCPNSIIKLSSVTRRILREYTKSDCTTPCQRACPAGIDIRTYIDSIYKGDFEKAVKVIKERNPFPSVIGRICPRPCEAECRRNYVDEPVAINFLKRFAADYERETNKRAIPFKAPETGKKIAVVGGGVAGLSAAFFSARLGHSATVLEASNMLGGLLRSAISKNRLKDEILDWDIEGIIETGVSAETNKVLGKDFTISSLLNEGFESVILESGGWDSRLANKNSNYVRQQVPGTYLLIDFIKNSGSIALGKNIVIAGTDRMSIEAAKLCIKKGAEKVTIIYRERREDLGYEEKTPSIEILYNKNINRLIGEGENLTELEYIDTKKRNTRIIEADNLFIGAGRFPELIFRKFNEDTLISIKSKSLSDGHRWEAVNVYKSPEYYKEKGFMSEGDVFSDYNAAIKAIGAGRRAAAMTHKLIYGIDIYFDEEIVSVNSDVQNITCVENVKLSPRNIMPLSSLKEIASGFEAEKGFTEEIAKKEASRCLKCGLICYEKTGGDLK